MMGNGSAQGLAGLQALCRLAHQGRLPTIMLEESGIRAQPVVGDQQVPALRLAQRRMSTG